jgi:hypothetical protein
MYHLVEAVLAEQFVVSFTRLSARLGGVYSTPPWWMTLLTGSWSIPA